MTRSGSPQHSRELVVPPQNEPSLQLQPSLTSALQVTTAQSMLLSKKIPCQSSSSHLCSSPLWSISKHFAKCSQAPLGEQEVTQQWQRGICLQPVLEQRPRCDQAQMMMMLPLLCVLHLELQELHGGDKQTDCKA